MPLNIKRNTVRNAIVGISVPETMNGDVSDNIVENVDSAIEVRSREQDLIGLLKEGYPVDKLTALLLHFSSHQQETLEQKVDSAKKSGLIEWLQPGITIMEFVTALISFASTFSAP